MVHCICVATLEYKGLLTLPLTDRVDRGWAVAIFSDWVFWRTSIYSGVTPFIPEAEPGVLLLHHAARSVCV